MLASMASAPTQPSFSIQQTNPDLTDFLHLEDRICPGCKKSAMSEQGALVVAFGQSFFHVACFKCAKCSNQVTADTNLLLLTDGSPICADCSYNCNVCHLPILDEAIMTGDDSYHAHCFKCKVCKDRIDELIFAKTSQGIYCMKCHNERMIKIRKYTQKKAERERNAGTGSSRTRDRDARNYHQDTGGQDSSSRPSSSRSNGAFSATSQQDVSYSTTVRGVEGPPYVRPVVKPKGPPQPHSGRAPLRPTSSHSNDAPTTMHLRSSSPSDSPSPNPAVTIAPPPENERPNPAKSSTLPVPPLGFSVDPDGRRRSYDDGVRPLQILFGQPSAPDTDTLRPDTAPAFTEGLSVTPRQAKRRSINPGLKLPNFNAALPAGSITTTLSPASAAFSDFKSPRSPVSSGDLESPHGQGQVSRPASESSSVRSYHSFMTPTDRDLTRSRSPSLTTVDTEDHTVVFKSPQSRLKGISRSPSPALIQATDGQLNSKTNGNRFSSTSNLSAEDRASAVSSRSNSPYHLVDVPRGIEDGSDSDGGGEAVSPLHSQDHSLPPALPPKDDEDYLRVQSPSLTEDADASGLSQYDDDMSESSPVERTSHTTFIAPALPPIRISLDSTGFSRLFVQGGSALKSLDQIATLLQADDADAPPTEPTSEAAPAVAAEPVSTAAEVQQLQKSQRVSPAPPPEERNTTPLEIKKLSQGNKPLPVPSISLNEPERKDEPVVDPVNSTNVPRKTSRNLGSGGEARPRENSSDAIVTCLRELLKDSQDHGEKQIQLEVEFLDAVIVTLDSRKVAYDELKENFDGIKRTSRNFIDGVLVAQAEYDKEQKARRDAEAEVTRLRVLLSGQAAKLTAMSSEDRRHEVRQQISKELNESLSGLEHDLSRLKLERDITLAEVEELSSTKTTVAPEKPTTSLSRSMTKRLDSLKKQYQRELIPLTEQRETLSREIAELKAIRDMFLEETTALNARNEELAQLSHIYTRRLESIPETPPKQGQMAGAPIPRSSFEKLRHASHGSATHPPPALAPSLSSSTSGSSSNTIHDDRYMKPLKQDTDTHTPRKLKWMGSNKTKHATSSAQEPLNSKGHMDHHFQQLSVLRFTRCDHCGDKLWGSQLRCTICSVSIHIRCAGGVQLPCAQHSREDSHLVSSMFGRDLVEQVQNDSQGDDRQVPIIVEKCILAVEATALEYEGIYRKTGGLSQTKMITQLFERGDYTSFDLLDTDRFNDISSVTSVLKNYFRSLPNPLLTYQLYEQFVQGISIKDIALKNRVLSDLVKQLPSEHLCTLRVLMIHLNRIHERSEKNLMNSRNLGVVLGPTLIRSPDPAAEFGDMAQRALFVEWLVENALKVFSGEA